MTDLLAVICSKSRRPMKISSRCISSPRSQPNYLLPVRMRTTILSVLLFVGQTSPFAHAATIIWTSASGTDTNWSTGANWTNATAGTSGTAPGSTDDAKFFDTAAGSVSNINNVVDGLFGGTVGSLQYGNTNNTHTTLIASGQTLNITGASGLVVGTPTDVGVAKNLTNVITGAGGTLNINNPSANLVLNQGTGTNVTLTRANLDMSGLDNFVMKGRRMGLGTTVLQNPGNANQR